MTGRSDKPRPGDIDDDVADWFEGTSADEVAAAVRAVETRGRGHDRGPGRRPAGRLPRALGDRRAVRAPGCRRAWNSSHTSKRHPGTPDRLRMPADYDGPGYRRGRAAAVRAARYQRPNYPPPGQR